MKKSLLFLLLPFFIFAQKKEIFKLKFPLKDYTRTTKSLEVIDARKDKNIKDIVYRGNYYSFKFPTDNLPKDIENWFEENNKNRNKATNDIVMLVEDLNIFNENRNNQIFCVLDMKISTFLKKDNSYYFLKRYDNAISLNTKEVGGIPNTFAENTQKVLQKLMFDTYRAVPNEIPIPIAELNNYNEILKEKSVAFTNNQLKEGVYIDYGGFFKQQPLANYQLIKKGEEVIRAVNPNDDKIPSRKFFCYVENGKAYKNTAIGFLEMSKDDKGFFVEANEGILFPDEVKISVFYFIAGGLIGGAVGGIVEGIKSDSKQKKALKAERHPIYIDFLNGEYSFVK
jgi:hypothetical protein